VKPLQIRLLTSHPHREDVQALADVLRAAGHRVLEEADDTTAADFVVTEASARPVPETLAAAEARHIAATLRHTGGNRRQAALLLGVARSTLLAKIRKYGL